MLRQSSGSITDLLEGVVEEGDIPLFGGSEGTQVKGCGTSLYESIYDRTNGYVSLEIHAWTTRHIERDFFHLDEPSGDLKNPFFGEWRWL